MAFAVRIYSCRIVSSMVERVRRSVPAAAGRATVRVGRIKCLKEPAPKEGRRPSFRENRVISISPSQKLGMEANTRATTTHTWSILEYWRTAEKMPMLIPRMEERHMDRTARIKVLGNLARMSCSTGWRVE